MLSYFLVSTSQQLHGLAKQWFIASEAVRVQGHKLNQVTHCHGLIILTFIGCYDKYYVLGHHLLLGHQWIY